MGFVFFCSFYKIGGNTGIKHIMVCVGQNIYEAAFLHRVLKYGLFICCRNSAFATSFVETAAVEKSYGGRRGRKFSDLADC